MNLKNISLNARAVAAYMTVGESAQRTTLRQYAKPKQQQKAAIVMYDPIRRNLREYFAGGRDEKVLSRVRELVEKHPLENKFDDAYRKSNRRALVNLKNLEVRGEFTEIERYVSSTTVGGLHVRSSIDFLAMFSPSTAKGKNRSVAVIVNPSGIHRGKPDARKRFARIECEFALRMLKMDEAKVEECWYIDLPKESISERYAHTSNSLWANIDAACERIVEDFKRYRLEHGEETA